METEYDYLFKIVLIGDSSVGKTSIVRRYIEGIFTYRGSATYGMDFCIKSLQIGSSVVKLQIWDTAGQEKFRAITQSYYRSADAIVLVYDIGAAKSFRSLPEWLLEVEEYAGSSVIRMLIGNKSDCNREITQEQGRQFAQKNDMSFLETSANNSNNIDELFLQLATKLLDSHIDKKPRSCEGGASLVPVPCTPSVQDYSREGKPPLTVTPKTVNKQASESKRGCCD